jgi:hypothetical protein
MSSSFAMVFSFKDGCFKLAQDDGAATMLLDASA